MSTASAELVEALRRPDAYPHPVDAIDLLETHISWVLLAGDHAYKIKKPVDLGFLDFSTLERRRHFCDEELRINRRLAPALYEAVVPIAGPPERARFARDGERVEAIEFAVRMRRFSQEALLSAVVRRGALSPAAIDRFAARIARFHAEVAVAGADSRYGTAEAIWGAVGDNVERLRAHPHEPALASRIGALADWTRDTFERLRPAFAERRARGLVRECHGDLHLGNMILEGDDVVVFDAIEFSEELRWIDTVSDVAFASMDLRHRGRPDLANRFANAWLEASGDYAGLAVWPFYAVYRALVRAKVGEIRLDAEEGGDGRAALAEDFDAYVALAEQLAAPRRPRLVLTCGPSGSGKTTGTQSMVEAEGAVRVRSDVERKRLHGLDALDASDSTAGGGIYDTASTARTYERLLALAETIATAGTTAIVDATFLKRAQRAPFRALARRLGVSLEILVFEAAPDELRRRVAKRAAEGRDASEATIAVLERQLESAEPVAAEEADRVTKAAPAQ